MESVKTSKNLDNNNQSIDNKKMSGIKLKKKKISKKNKKLENYENDSDKYLDLGCVGRGFVILGSILLLIYLVFIIISLNPAEGSIWDDSYTGDIEAVSSALPISMILIAIGVIFYFFHFQFVRLSEFATEVESGEFEKKVLKELDVQYEK